MLITLFHTIKKAGVPCTLRELLDLLGALEKNFAFADLDDFYFLSRAALVKDEKHYDCLLYTSPSPRDRQKSRMPSSA